MIMQSKLLAEEREKTYALVFRTGDDFMGGLKGFARKQGLSAARFTAIGAFRRATLAFFDTDTREYENIPVDEQVEVLSLSGSVSREEEDVRLHVHAVFGRRDGSTVGGHLLDAEVRPTLEVLLVESPGYLRRRFDSEAGLPLIDLES
jgi:predicted DNA-binding protein with PD1-like motif